MNAECRGIVWHGLGPAPIRSTDAVPNELGWIVCATISLGSVFAGPCPAPDGDFFYRPGNWPLFEAAVRLISTWEAGNAVVLSEYPGTQELGSRTGPAAPIVSKRSYFATSSFLDECLMGWSWGLGRSVFYGAKVVLFSDKATALNYKMGQSAQKPDLMDGSGRSILFPTGAEFMVRTNGWLLLAVGSHAQLDALEESLTQGLEDVAWEHRTIKADSWFDERVLFADIQ